MKELLISTITFGISSAALISLALIPASAQTTAAVKTAVIQTEKYMDEAAGIKRLVEARSILKREFEQKEKEILARAEAVDLLAMELWVLRGKIGQKYENDKRYKAKESNWMEQREKVQFEINELRESRRERESDIEKTIIRDISDALRAFAKKRGIGLLIDLSEFRGAYLGNDAVDITAEFIAEFNAMPAKP